MIDSSSLCAFSLSSLSACLFLLRAVAVRLVLPLVASLLPACCLSVLFLLASFESSRNYLGPRAWDASLGGFFFIPSLAEDHSVVQAYLGLSNWLLELGPEPQMPRNGQPNPLRSRQDGSK